MALDQAKGINMPKDNIERAITRATGPGEGEIFYDFLFEGYGPGNVALLVEGITDNKNRAVNDVKTILNQNNGKMVGEGAIRWMFERKGMVIVKLEDQPESKQNKESLEMDAIEAGWKEKASKWNPFHWRGCPKRKWRATKKSKSKTKNSLKNSPTTIPSRKSIPI